MKTEITIEELRQLLQYDSDTGMLTWLPRPLKFCKSIAIQRDWNCKYANKLAFTSTTKFGYQATCIFGVKYYAHRVAWALHYGEWSTNQIDHINGNRMDNRVENLRVVKHSENGKNQKRPTTNKSGVIGVYWDAAKHRWRAQITVNGDRVHLGYFDSHNDAVVVRRDAEHQCGFHFNHGRA